MKSGM